MMRQTILAGLLAVTGASLGVLTGPATAQAGGCDVTVYNNYGNAVYYNNYTSSRVTYSSDGVYIPANYPGNFVYPTVAPVASSVVYREPVYPTPVVYQPVYTPPVYVRPVYVAPVLRRSVSFGFGFSTGYHREAYRSRRIVHREVYLPSVHYRSHDVYRPTPYYRTLPSHRYYGSAHGGARVRVGHRH